MSLISCADKTSMTADFAAAIDTWARPLVVYQEAQIVRVNSDPNYNPYTAYNQNNTTVEVTPVATTVSGRILWDNQQEWAFLTPFHRQAAEAAQLKVKDDVKRACRLKVDPSGYNLLATAKLVEIDGVQLVPESQPRPHGLFWPTHYTFYYVRQM